MKIFFQLLNTALLSCLIRKRTLQIGSFVLGVTIMGILWPSLLGAQVNKCQDQCTSTSPEGPCNAVRSSSRYSACVAKCKQACNDCGQQSITAEPELVFRLYTVDCPSDAVLDKLSIGLKSKLKQLGLANPDVRPQCQSGVVTSLVWSSQPKNSCEDSARNVATLPSDFTTVPFGIYITKGLLAGLAQASFRDNPTLRTVPGYPSIHLNSLAVHYLDKNGIQGFEAMCRISNSCPKNLTLTANNVVTLVNGHDDRPTPSVDFKLTVIDELKPRITGDNQVCHPMFDPTCGCGSFSWTNVSELDEILAIPGLIAGLVSVDFPMAGVFETLTGDINAFVDHPGGGGQGGVGCSVYQSLPDEIALPQTGHTLAFPITAITRSRAITRSFLIRVICVISGKVLPFCWTGCGLYSFRPRVLLCLSHLQDEI